MHVIIYSQWTVTTTEVAFGANPGTLTTHWILFPSSLGPAIRCCVLRSTTCSRVRMHRVPVMRLARDIENWRVMLTSPRNMSTSAGGFPPTARQRASPGWFSVRTSSVAMCRVEGWASSAFVELLDVSTSVPGWTEIQIKPVNQWINN